MNSSATVTRFHFGPSEPVDSCAHHIPSLYRRDVPGFGGSAPVRFDAGKLLRVHGDAISRTVTDLFTTLSTIYCVDKWAPRETSADDGWTRHLVLDIAVSDPDPWNATPVNKTLSTLVRFLSSDRWELRFHRAPEPPAPLHPALFSHHRAVTLFSGGLDSFGFAACREPATHADTIYLGHQEPRSVTGVQERLADSLSIPDANLAGFLFQVREFQNSGNEPTQRTRGLLFMGMGLLLASSHRIEVLTVPENGFVALNPALTPSRPGACMTKSVHPFTLCLLNTLLTQLNVDIQVENPLESVTKGEVCRRAVEAGHSLARLAKTVSCSHSHNMQTGDFDNCGYCYPCLVRHASLEWAGGDRTEYRYDPRRPERFKDKEAYLALTDWLSRDFATTDLIGAAPLPPDADLDALTDVVLRSREELAAAFPPR